MAASCIAISWDRTPAPHYRSITDYQTAISLVSVCVGVCIVPRSVSATQHGGVMYRDFLGPNPGTSLSVNYRLPDRDQFGVGLCGRLHSAAIGIRYAAWRRHVSRFPGTEPRHLIIGQLQITRPRSVWCRFVWASA